MRAGARRQRPFADGAADGIPDLLLIFLDHGALAHGGLNHETVGRGFCGCTEGGGTLSPPAGLDAEDTQVDRICADGNDTIFGDDAVLLAASDYFAGEKKQRPAGVVDEDESVDLISAIGVCGWAVRAASNERVNARTDETLNAAGFSDFNFAGLDSFVESDERGFARRFSVGADDGEE
jgi:hypothetical protein